MTHLIADEESRRETCGTRISYIYPGDRTLPVVAEDGSESERVDVCSVLCRDTDHAFSLTHRAPSAIFASPRATRHQAVQTRGCSGLPIRGFCSLVSIQSLNPKASPLCQALKTLQLGV